MGDERKTPVCSRATDFPSVVGDPGKKLTWKEKATRSWHIARHTWRGSHFWVWVVACVLLVLWQVDVGTSGKVHEGLGWIYQNIMCDYPIVPFVLGGLLVWVFPPFHIKNPFDRGS